MHNMLRSEGTSSAAVNITLMCAKSHIWLMQPHASRHSAGTPETGSINTAKVCKSYGC